MYSHNLSRSFSQKRAAHYNLCTCQRKAVEHLNVSEKLGFFNPLLYGIYGWAKGSLNWRYQTRFVLKRERGHRNYLLN